MVHIFESEGIKLGFDSETGSLHLLDDVSYPLLKEYIKTGGKRPTGRTGEKLENKFGPDYDTACSEIESLIDEGSLFSCSKNIRMKDLYDEKPKIKAMCLHISHDCNLRCRYCFASTGDYKTGDRKNMSFETARNAVDFLIERSGTRKNLDIDFFGGEPLLNWDTVKKVTEYCEIAGPEKNKNIRLTITTNAVLLDDEKTEYINMHMDNCVLSIDGRPEINDIMRTFPSGSSSYEIVAANIKRFIEKRNKKPYYVRGTFTKKNPDFSQDVRHIVSMGVSSLSIEPVVTSSSSPYAITEEDLDAIYEEYDKLAKFYVESAIKKKPFEFFHFAIDDINGPCLYKRVKGCGVGSEYVAVTPDGDIYPCHQFVGESQFVMGNVNDANKELDKNVKDMFNKLLVPQKKECDKCWAKYYCAGGCPANAYFSTGDINGVYDIGCKLHKKRMECALWIKASLAIHKQ